MEASMSEFIDQISEKEKQDYLDRCHDEALSINAQKDQARAEAIARIKAEEEMIGIFTEALGRRLGQAQQPERQLRQEQPGDPPVAVAAPQTVPARRTGVSAKAEEKDWSPTPIDDDDDDDDDE
jgi:hypothetical protein